MKSLLCVFLFAGFLAIAHTFPGVPRDNSDESDEKLGGDTILILPGLPRNPFHSSAFQPNFHFPDIADDDDDENFGLHPFKFSFDPTGLFKSMQDAMNKLKAQLANSFSGIPKPGALGPWGNVPEDANTTSTTKVIDGHVVTINETVYKSDDDNTYVRFRIVDVKPENTTGVTTDAKDIDQSSGEVTDSTTNDNTPSSSITPTTTESTKEETTKPRSVETVEDLGNNEIPNNKDDSLKA